ncbi:MAG: hypothetical protein JSS49_25145 [Planctomycetes bacterium]|nr:hypothetical protein [Planctomycetota bacterium]
MSETSSRVDLLALTPDDLAAMTNRGTVKRAQKELDEGALTCTFREDGQEVVCEWSDGITCRFPAGKTVHDAVCSSGVVGISRHIVRSVLAYQMQVPAVSTSPDPAASDPSATAGTADQTSAAVVPVPAQSDWNPGDITDDQLIDHFRAATIKKTRQRFEQGVLVELIRGPKPLARFLDESCTIRFLVPGDVRYVTADCADGLLGMFVPMAVWAFRELEPGRRSGLVATQQRAIETPVKVLDELDSALAELCVDGLQGVSATWSQRLIRHETACRDEGLTWLAELVADLIQQREMYAARDALFDPQTIVRLTGEMQVRSRAIRSGTTAIPQFLIRGSHADRTTDLASSRLVGLGCGVRQTRRSATITAFLQDVDSGSVVGVERSFADPPEDSPDLARDFSSLSDTVVSRGISLAAIGTGQLLIKSGKRTPGGRLILPRTSAGISLNPQAFAWEHLRAPLAVEGFAELSARLDLLPPSCLRPRRLTEALHVCPLERIEDVTFDIQSQRLVGTAIDIAGERAVISHPFTTRGKVGFEGLAAALADPALKPRFICGQVSRRQSGVLIEPVCLVFETAEGKRRAISPWIESRAAETRTGHDVVPSDATVSPLQAALNELGLELNELLLNGLRRTGASGAKRWGFLASQVRRVGFVRLGDRIHQLSTRLAEHSERVQWDPAVAVSQTFNLLMLCRLADDIPAE